MDMLRSSLKDHRRPMLQAPTGMGKTIIAAAIVEGALSKGKRVLFVVPYLSLIDQTVRSFAAQGIHAVGVMQGYHPQTDGSQPVQVASIQTLQRRKVPQADVVVIDEAHRWFKFLGEWMTDPAWARVPFIGLSATPWAKGLGKFYDDLIIAATTAELIATVNPSTGRTYLSPFTVFAPSHPDLSKVSTVAGDYHEGELSEVMSQPILVGDVVRTWLRAGEDRSTLCFAVDRAHARKLANEFEAAGVPSGYIDANTERDEREAIGRRLHEGQLKVVCNVGTLTTGIDWDVRCVILARPTKSEMLFTQIIGRGLRNAEGKSECIILDHSDTTLRLGFVTDIHHDALDDGRPKESSAAKRERSAPLPKECSACSRLKPAGLHKCPSCGFAPERQSGIEEMDGELVAIKGRKKAKTEATPHDKQAFWSMCLWYVEERGQQRGAASHRYKERFGVWPRGLADVPAEPDLAFLNFVKSRQIAYAKSRKRQPMTENRHAA